MVVPGLLQTKPGSIKLGGFAGLLSPPPTPRPGLEGRRRLRRLQELLACGWLTTRIGLLQELVYYKNWYATIITTRIGLLEELAGVRDPAEHGPLVYYNKIVTFPVALAKALSLACPIVADPGTRNSCGFPCMRGRTDILCLCAFVNAHEFTQRFHRLLRYHHGFCGRSDS